MAQQPLIAIVGPTGSGKTALAVELARSRMSHAERSEASRQVPVMPRDPSPASPVQDDVFFELVSADSRQVYRGMDIGTGKEHFSDVPQHLIDMVNPDEDFTLSDFLDRAKQVIEDIHARGNVPIVVGGTGLYVQALVENWNIPAVRPNPALRAELEKKSVDALQRELAAIDPEEVERLGLGKRYLIRALEMWHATGRKPSALKTKNEPLYDALVIGIDLPREELYRRIDARVDAMFTHGLVDEVRGLMEKYHVSHPEAAEGSHAFFPAFNTIGYREIIEYCHSGRRDPESSKFAGSRIAVRDGFRDDKLDAVIQSIKYVTHAYARRQLTWLRRMKYVEWLGDTKDVLSRVASFLRN